MMVDRAYFINLKRRPDRLEAFKKEIETKGWKLPEPIIYPAIDGNKVGCPTYFVSGGGAFGCFRSHINILEQCLNEGVESVAVFEDDLCWRTDTWERLDQFMKVVPDDWQCLWLGGQITAPTIRKNEGCIQLTNMARTHAYIVRGAGLKGLLHNWYSCNRHIDHVLAPFCKSHKVYAPEPFLFGQGEGNSDISGKKDEGKRYWSKPDKAKPVLWLDPLLSLQVVNELRNQHKWHRGNWLDKDGYDRGLAKAKGNRRLVQKVVDVLSWEVASDQGDYVAIWHPMVSAELLRQIIKGTPVVEITGPTVSDCLVQLEEHGKV